MAIITTNSPQFLRYFTSTFTREEVLNSPEYCHMLEDPDIKDDVEIAFKYNDAINGGYEEKKEFIQYLLCNGPELDVQTILYYRDIILSDRELNDIYRMEFSYDTASIQLQLRNSLYDKDSLSSSGKKNNCFSDPGAYLGPFNVTLTMGVNPRDWQNPRNVYAEIAKFKEKEAKKKQQGKNGSNGESKQGDATTMQPTPQNMPANDRGKRELTPQVGNEVAKVEIAAAATEMNNKDNSAMREIKRNTGDANAIETARESNDALILKIIPATADETRAYFFGKNYNSFDPSKNKKMPIGNVLKYKYPFGLRKQDAMMTGANNMSPYNLVGSGSILYEDSDNAMLSTFDVVGSFVTTEISQDTQGQTGTLYTNVGNNPDPHFLAGELQYGRRDNTMLCPSAVSDGDYGAKNFVVGAHVNKDIIIDYFKKFFQESNLTATDYEALLRSGVVNVKIKLSTGAGTDIMGGIVHTSVVVTLPVIGETSLSGESGIKYISIDPMVILNNEKLSNYYSLNDNSGRRLTTTFNGKINSDGTISGYTSKLIAKPRQGYTYTLNTSIEKKMCRIRFYVNPAYKASIKDILGRDVQFNDAFFSPGDMGESFIETVVNVNAIVGGGNGDLNYYITKPIYFSPPPPGGYMLQQQYSQGQVRRGKSPFGPTPSSVAEMQPKCVQVEVPSGAKDRWRW